MVYLKIQKLISNFLIYKNNLNVLVYKGNISKLFSILMYGRSY